jgi:hypothetical protein
VVQGFATETRGWKDHILLKAQSKSNATKKHMPNSTHRKEDMSIANPSPNPTPHHDDLGEKTFVPMNYSDVDAMLEESDWRSKN